MDQTESMRPSQIFRRTAVFFFAVGTFFQVMLVDAAPLDVEPAPSTSSIRASRSKFRGADGWFDVSKFLNEAYGFVPIVKPITEPAVGYGLGAALLFVGRDKTKPFSEYYRPNLTAIGGMATENASKAAFAMDSRYWLDQRIQTIATAFDGSINLDFYGIGGDPRYSGQDPLSYNLRPRGGVFQTKMRLKGSPLLVGMGYARAETEVAFDAPLTDPRIPDIKRKSNVGGGLLSATYDSRDNVFTPLRGAYADLSGGLYSPSLGGDDSFQRAGITLIQYVPMHRVVTLGVNGGANFSFGDSPFYMLPFVNLRGVSLMRYQGKQAAQAEAEIRWQYWERFSLVFFGGVGAAWNDLKKENKKTTVESIGTGFRYDIAHDYGLHMGLDVAKSRDESAIYIIVGSAWLRP